MQSVATKRGGGSDFSDEDLDRGAVSPRQLSSNDAELLDDNAMERILSRPSLPRKKLELFEAPEFVQRLTNYQEATVGDTVTFSGQYRAFPRPTVKWFKDEEEIGETQRHVIDLSSEANGIVRLIIQQAILLDEGAYKCKVENQDGVASTTGYLSVFSDKCPDKGNSNQAKKTAPDKVSTTPFLRPIVEQKSMEEREEKEYQRLPPSPLQEFMAKIRHGTKSMNGPVVYADLAGVYPDEDVIKDFESVTTEDEAEMEVFDEQDRNSATPSASPVDEKDGPDFPTDTPNNNTIQSALTFLTPASTTVVMETQLSGEDSAYDSDGQDCQTPVVRNGTWGTGCNGTGTQSTVGESSSQSNRRLKLTLRRAEAVELSDIEPLHSGCITAIDAKFPVNSPTAPNVVERQKEDVSFFREEHKEIDGQTEREISEAEETALGKEVCTRSAADVVFGWIDSPWYQFFTVLIVSAQAIGLFGGVPTAYLITALMIISVISFVVLEHRFTIERHD